MEEVKVSVIVPVYNVEKYLDRTIRSLQPCSVPAEFIFVNDGSTDGSEEIIRKYQKEDARIKLINRENGGLSVARNIGLENANGKYILYLDSDDTLEGGKIAELYDIIEANNLDLLQFQFDKIDEEDKPADLSPGELSIRKNPVNVVYSGSEWLKNNVVLSNVWTILYKRDLLIENNIRFIEGYVHEDVEYTPKVIYFAKRIMCTELLVYHYRKRAGSVTKRTDIKRSKDALYTTSKLEEFVEKNVDVETQQTFFDYFLSGSFAVIINEAVRHGIKFDQLFDKADAGLKFKSNVINRLMGSKSKRHRFVGMCLKYNAYFLLRTILKCTDKYRGIPN